MGDTGSMFLGFMLAGILPLGVVFHLRIQPDPAAGSGTTALAGALAWLLLSAGLLAAGALYAGWNSLRRREFG